MSSFSSSLEGFLTGLSLIIAIGPQNAFVLKQALQKNHLFLTAFLCAAIDALFILIGIAGLGIILTSNPFLLGIAKWGGAGFLIIYGLKSFLSVFKREAFIVHKESNKPSVQKTILILLGLSFLNPHMYLDTCVLLGTIGGQQPLPDRYFFALGAIIASFAWFFSLCYGGKYLLPLFKKPIAWKILDFLIGCIMWMIAAFLLFL